jgi:spermidine synthase
LSLPHPAWIPAGLFLTTFATLLIEILSSRLLSVITWYHLSFFAVSLAMLGMAAGAVAVFLGGRRYAGDRARATLAQTAINFAIAIPLSHLATLYIPLPSIGSAGVPQALAALAASTIALTVPFFLSGIVVTIALTRVGGRIGRLYAWDLAGAAAGAAAVVPLLELITLPSAFLVAGAAAAGAAWCFQRSASLGRRAVPIGLAVILFAGAAVNEQTGGVLRPLSSKDRRLPPADLIDRAVWNSHTFVLIQKAFDREPFYWGAGARAPLDRTITSAWMVIDGDAGTVLSKWDGTPEALDWVRHDVTAAPYYLRHGHAGVIGVGGGRDILSALWGGNQRVTGIEINGLLVDTLSRTHREFARIAVHPAVTIVHDEARSYLTRSEDRVDILQMSLIDTWAATGAGAFTLTENGLYTREGWRVFLEALTPSGIFSVSRWYHPDRGSETNRLVSLGVAALLDRGIVEPRAHMVLLARGNVATLMVSPAPFTSDDRERVIRLAADEAFDIVLSPWTAPAIERHAAFVASRSLEQLDAATADPIIDYSAPTDARPFFFNQIKPRALLEDLPRASIASGNAGATLTLIGLCGLAALLVAAIIL